MNKQTYLIQDLQYGDGGKGKLCDMLITNLLKTNDKSNLVCIDIMVERMLVIRYILIM